MASEFRLEAFLPFRLNMLASELSERLSSIYAGRFGLDIPQWRILANLASRGGATAQEIVRITRDHKSTVSRAVRALEERGLIVRGVAKDDKRAHALKLSGDGERLFKQLLPLVLAFERDIVGSLAAGDAKALSRGIGALEESLKATRGGPPW